MMAVTCCTLMSLLVCRWCADGVQICVGVVFYLDIVPSRHHVDFSTVICFFYPIYLVSDDVVE